MEFTNEEIALLVKLLEAEKKKGNRRKVYHSPTHRAKVESVYQKLLSLMRQSNETHLKENGYHCDRCQCPTPESELDTNDGICNQCVVAERNG